MKNIFKSTLALGLLVVSLMSCSDDDGNITVIENPNTVIPTNGSALPSEVLAGDTLLLAEGSSFSLTQALRVKESATLKIEPGVTITAQGGTPTSLFIVIESGAKILAEGTDSQPIVFTAADKTPGAWGGLLIAGKAPINVGNSAIAEIGDVLYGGDDANDNSGILRYVRTEFTGSEINSEKQHNGFTFYGVGAGTTVEYIQAYKGADDGIEFFGGTVNVQYVAVMGSQDDQFDFAEGWTGTGRNIYLEQVNDPNFDQDKGIEGDNLKGDNSAAPFSNPTISAVTIIGYPDNVNADDESTDGIRIREGAKGSFDNIVIKNYGDEGIDARSLVTLENLVSGDLSFSNIFVEGVGDKAIDAKVDDGEEDPGTVDADATMILNNSLVETEPAGANFAAWAGSWVKSL